MTILVAAVLVAGTVPTMALGQSNAGIDEYTEEVPGAGGGKPTSGDSGDDPSGGGPLSTAQISSLEELGVDGAAVAELAQGTGSGGSDGTPGSTTAPGGEDSSSGVADVVGDLAGDSESGIGIALPIVLGLTLLGAVAFVVARRSGGRPGAA